MTREELLEFAKQKMTEGIRDELSRIYREEEALRLAGHLEKGKGFNMHYRNGREAKNGDKIVKLEGGKVVSFGVLHSAVPGNDFCNGNIATIQMPNDYACLCDCLHVDDLAAILAEKGLYMRPDGK